MRTCLDDNLGHHGVADHPGDQAKEPVTGGLQDHGPRRGPFNGLGQLLGKPGEDCAIDALSAGLVDGRRQATAVCPAANGVVTDAEQVGRFADAEN